MVQRQQDRWLWTEAKLHEIDKRTERIMAALDDLEAKADALTAQVAKNTDLDASIIAIVRGNAQLIRDLKAALDAANTGNDPRIAAVSAKMGAAADKLVADDQTIADAVTENTSAA